MGLFRSSSATDRVRERLARGELLLDYEKLAPIAARATDAYQAAVPFPHVILDDFVDSGIIDAMLKEFPQPNDKIGWARRDVDTEDGRPASVGKLDFGNVVQLGPTLRQLAWELNSKPFLRFLQQLTGIKRLIPDPHFVGGGVHQTGRDGMLRVHADFQKHPVFGLNRRINVLLYLNQDWKEEYGGHIELWDREMKGCVASALPVAGRCLIFNTDADSYHGQPQPLTCPPGMTRKSLAIYYYTNGLANEPPAEQPITNWQLLPHERAKRSA